MKPAAEIAAVLVALGCTAVVVYRAATAPLPAPKVQLTAEECAGVASSIAAMEADWRDKAADDFPADQWSQRDAFHGHEAAAVRDYVRSSGTYEQIFRAIDDDIHKRRGGDRSVSAVPCHPRPVFD